jgi:hypothetical protein
MGCWGRVTGMRHLVVNSMVARQVVLRFFEVRAFIPVRLSHHFL